MKKLKKGTIVEVTCYDHAADAEWLNEEKKMAKKPPILHVIGRVEHQDKVALYLSHFLGEDGKCKESDIDTIVIGAITEIWELNYVGKQPIYRSKT